MSVAPLVRLTWVRQWRARKLLWSGSLVLLVLAAAAAARYLGETGDPEELFSSTLRVGFFRLLVFIVPLIHASGIVAEDARADRLTYLTSRPIPRLRLVLGLYTATAGIVVCVLSGGVLGLHIVLHVADPGELIGSAATVGRAVAAVALIGALYSAVCLAASALTVEASGVVVALYFAIVELLLSFAPGVFRVLSANHLASELAGLPIEGGVMPERVPPVAWSVATGVIGVETLVFLLAAALIVRMSEYRYGKA